MIIPPYCPHLSNRMMNPIAARLWDVMHKHVTPNKCSATCGQFADAALGFLRDKVPKKRGKFRDSVTANFRVINPRIFGL